ncbi:MAG TPA: cellulase family glycosylhydrolase [Gaiellaceae bacterium]|nr:cellulase family glycosylhydrolase [Gaiellaceae bacterium]
MAVTSRNICVGVAVVVLAAVAASTGSASARRASHSIRTYSTHGTLPLRTSLDDPFTFTGPNRAAGFVKARSSGASYVRLVVPWNLIAPDTVSSSFDPADPASPAYSWSWLDSTVSAAETAGLTPILDIVRAPSWALATKHGKRIFSPKVSALGQFAKALALRYDGKHEAPPAHVFQVWNEPNLSQDISPVNAATYRSMVNAVATAVHGVSSANRVVAGGLDPFGNKGRGWHSVSPLAYMRSLLCISMGNPRAKSARLRKPHATCKAKATFDIWSHHPYTFNGPFGHAKRKDDVSLGDLPKMRSLLRTAIKLHRISARHGVQFWVTEFSWDTKPPRRHAAPVGLASRWTAEALYQMWKSGVSLVTWFGLEDKGGKSPYQSGLYFHASSLSRARAKPVRTAFRFPFVAYLGRHTVSVWGRDATSNARVVSIQRRVGTHGSWRTVARVRANRVGIFRANLRLAASRKDWLRAVAAGSGNSLAFSLNPPSPKLRYGPWGN